MAYRRLAHIYHPDVNRVDPNAEAKFKSINEAYQVLSDSELRQQYDQSRIEHAEPIYTARVVRRKQERSLTDIGVDTVVAGVRTKSPGLAFLGGLEILADIWLNSRRN